MFQYSVHFSLGSHYGVYTEKVLIWKDSNIIELPNTSNPYFLYNLICKNKTTFSVGSEPER